MVTGAAMISRPVRLKGAVVLSPLMWPFNLIPGS